MLFDDLPPEFPPTIRKIGIVSRSRTRLSHAAAIPISSCCQCASSQFVRSQFDRSTLRVAGIKPWSLSTQNEAQQEQNRGRSKTLRGLCSKRESTLAHRIDLAEASGLKLRILRNSCLVETVGHNGVENHEESIGFMVTLLVARCTSASGSCEHTLRRITTVSTIGVIHRLLSFTSSWEHLDRVWCIPGRGISPKGTSRCRCQSLYSWY